MAETGTGPRLAHFAARLFTLAPRLRRAKEPESGTALRNEVARLMAEFDQEAQAVGYAVIDSQTARHAIAALLDEIVLGSNWSFRPEWEDKPLAGELFGDFQAGRTFYEKIETLRGAEDPHKIDVLEIYALCLGLEFMGMHAGLAGLEKIRLLKDELAREIRRARGITDSTLSPHWQSEAKLPELIRRTPVWIVAAACAGALLLLFAILWWVLDEQLDGFLVNTAGR